MIEALPGIAYRFRNPELLSQALTHRSHGPVHNERLEFLGDSVFNLIVSARLFELHPQAAEGDLSRMRARIVGGRTLAGLARRIELGQHLRLGPGETRSAGFHRASILADALEAVFGAIYLDSGLAACRKVVLSLCDALILDLPGSEQLKDAKTRLQEWLQARGRPLPAYTLVQQEGAAHARRFHVECRVPDGDAAVCAAGSSRRQAEQAAAALLLERIAGIDPAAGS